MTSNKIIVSVLGMDRVGIIAAVTNTLAGANANILDISQTILEGFFTMIMVVDISPANVDFPELKEQLEQTGTDLGVQINAQNSSVFEFMHRL